MADEYLDFLNQQAAPDASGAGGGDDYLNFLNESAGASPAPSAPRRRRPTGYAPIEDRRAAREAAKKAKYAERPREITQAQAERRMRTSESFMDRYLQRNIEQIRAAGEGMDEAFDEVVPAFQKAVAEGDFIDEDSKFGPLGKALGRGVGGMFQTAVSPITAYGREVEASSPAYSEADPMQKAGIVVAKSLTGAIEDIPAEAGMRAGQWVGLSDEETEAAMGYAGIVLPFLKHAKARLGIGGRGPRVNPYEQARARMNAAAEGPHPLAQQEFSSAWREAHQPQAVRQAGTYSDAVTGRLEGPTGAPQPYDRPAPTPYMGIEQGGKARLVAKGKGQPSAPGEPPGMGGALPETPGEPFMGRGEARGVTGPRGGEIPPLVEIRARRQPGTEGYPTEARGVTGPRGGSGEVLPVDVETGQPVPTAPPPRPVPESQPSIVGEPMPDGPPVPAGKIVDRIIRQTEGEPQRRAISERVRREGDYYRERDVRLDDLSVENAHDIDPARAMMEKGAIVVDRQGNVLDGRHRVVAARARGDATIRAYEPIDPPRRATSIAAEPMPPSAVPDVLPPEAGGATGLETPGVTKPLHRSLQGADITDAQRVSGLVDRLLAEDPTADLRIIKVRARDQLRAAGEPLLLDDVLAKEIESRQFGESVEPRPLGKTGAEIAAEPMPPAPKTNGEGKILTGWAENQLEKPGISVDDYLDAKSVINREGMRQAGMSETPYVPTRMERLSDGRYQITHGDKVLFEGTSFTHDHADQIHQALLKQNPQEAARMVDQARAIYDAQPPAPSPAPKPQAPETPGSSFGRRSERGSIGVGEGGPLPSIETAAESARKAWEKATDRAVEAAKKLPGADLAEYALVHEPERVSKKFAEAIYGYRGHADHLAPARANANRAIVRNVFKDSNRATTEAVIDYMGSVTDALPESLTKKQRDAVKLVSERMRASSLERVRLGDLAESTAAEYPRHLRRIYDAHRAETSGKIWAKGTRPRIGKTIARMDAYNIVVDLPKGQVDGMLAGLDTQNVVQTGKRTLVKFKTAADRTRFQTRLRENRLSRKTVKGSVTDPLPKEWREAFGEVRDLPQLVAETTAYNERRIAARKFLDRMVEDGDPKGKWSISNEEAAKLPQGKDKNTRVGNGVEYTYTGNKNLGPLADRWVRSDVLPEVNGVVGMREPGFLNDVIRPAWRAGISEWKANRTSRSLSTHVLNILSAPIMLDQAGLPLYDPRNFKYLRQAFERLVKNDPYAKDLAERIASEIVGVSYADMELGAKNRTIAEFVGRAAGSGGLSLLESVPGVGKGYKALDRGASRLYSFYDNIIRDAAYTKARAKGMTHAQAVTETNLYTPNYARVGPLVRVLRNSPVGSPFLSFAYEQKRILINNLRHNPVRAVRVLLATKMMGEGIEAMFGADDITDEEREALRRSGEGFGMGGGWFGFSSRINTGRDEEGNLKWFDIGQLDPNIELLAGPSGAIDSSIFGMEAEATNNLLYAARVFGIQANPIYDGLITVARGRTRYGKELRTKGDYAGFVWSQAAHPYMPGGSKYRRVERAFNPEERNQFHDIQTKAEALLDALLHVSMGTYSPEQANALLRYEFEREKKDIVSSARSEIRDNRSDPEARREAAQEGRVRLRTLQQRAREEKKARVAPRPQPVAD